MRPRKRGPREGWPRWGWRDSPAPSLCDVSSGRKAVAETPAGSRTARGPFPLSSGRGDRCAFKWVGDWISSKRKGNEADQERRQWLAQRKTKTLCWKEKRNPSGLRGSAVKGLYVVWAAQTRERSSFKIKVSVVKAGGRRWWEGDRTGMRDRGGWGDRLTVCLFMFTGGPWAWFPKWKQFLNENYGLVYFNENYFQQLIFIKKCFLLLFFLFRN